MTTTTTRPTGGRLPALAAAAGRGAAAGLAGVAVMTAAEKLEQVVTGRPDSYVPGRTMAAMMRRPTSDAEKPLVANHAMHWGTGAALGALRGVWSVTGVRGWYPNLTHTLVRLSFDQSLENASGMGAPPAVWPLRERVIDVLHKAAYSVTTGVVADRWIRPRLESHRGTTSH